MSDIKARSRVELCIIRSYTLGAVQHALDADEVPEEIIEALDEVIAKAFACGKEGLAIEGWDMERIHPEDGEAFALLLRQGEEP